MVSVNLSARQFGDGELVAKFTAAMRAASANPARMELEVTESMLLSNCDEPIRVLRAFEALGMSISLDDFGTGYSNLAYLQRFPIHTLKIDKTFIQGITSDKPLAELIVAMCRLMKLSIVAEGVETLAQQQWVVEHKIEQYQGYLFARPLAVPAFDQLLARTIETASNAVANTPAATATAAALSPKRYSAAPMAKPLAPAAR